MKKPHFLLASSWAWFALFGAALTSFPRLLADDGNEPPVTFNEIVETQTRETFRLVAEYLQTHPVADDKEYATRWLLKTAREQGWEDVSIDLARQAADDKILGPETRTLAMEVRCVGLARKGELPAAVESFQEYAKTIRLRSAERILTLAEALGNQCQLAGEYEGMRVIYEDLSSQFFLNQQVRELCEVKLSKLDLLAMSAPRVLAHDINGTRYDSNDDHGKVLLIDFWATNCPPCLDEFPRMKKMYDELHPLGLEVVGISFDDKVETVQDFQAVTPLPWTLVMLDKVQGAIRKQYHVETIPATYLVDQQGKITQFDLRGPELHQAVKKLLEK
ncbi:MAG: TlpA disulfide reductase family protein [Planctomycetaceae bacterium]